MRHRPASGAISRQKADEGMAEARIALWSHRQELCEAVRVAFSFAGLRFSAVSEAEALDAELSGEDPARAVFVDLASAPDPTALARQVRAAEAGTNAALFFLGGGDDSIASTDGALSAGGDAYFALPVEAARVLARLATYLNVVLPRIPASLELPAAHDVGEPQTDAGDDDGAPLGLVGLAPPLDKEPDEPEPDQGGAPAGFDLVDDDGDEHEVTAEIDPRMLSQLHAQAAAHRTVEGYGGQPDDDGLVHDEEDEGAGDIARRVQRLRSRLAEGRRDLDPDDVTSAGGAAAWSLSQPSGLVAPEGAEDDDDDREERAREAAEGFDALTERITEDDLASALAGVRELGAAAGDDEYPPLDAMPALALSSSSEGDPVPAPPDEPLTGWDPPPLDPGDDDEKTTSGFLSPPPTFAQEQDEAREEEQRALDEVAAADEDDVPAPPPADDVPAPPPGPDDDVASAVGAALEDGDALAAVEAALAPPALHFPDAEVAPLLDELGLATPPDDDLEHGRDDHGAPGGDDDDPVTGAYAAVPLEQDTHVDAEHEAVPDGDSPYESAEAEMAAAFDAAAVTPDVTSHVESEPPPAPDPATPDPAAIEALVEERVSAAVEDARREADERVQALEVAQREAEQRLREELEARLAEVERQADADGEEADEELQRLEEELANEKQRASEAQAEAALRARELEEQKREEQRLREQLASVRASADDARKELEERLLRDADERAAALAHDLADVERRLREEEDRRQALEAERVQQAEEEERLREELEAKLREEADARVAEVERRLGAEADARVAEVERRLGAEADARVAEVERRLAEEADARVADVERRLGAEAARLREELEAKLREEADARVAEAERAAAEEAEAERELLESALRDQAEAERRRLEGTLREEGEQRAREAAQEAAEAARREAEERLLADAERWAQEAAQQAAEAARREAEERLLAEAARNAEEAERKAQEAAEKAAHDAAEAARQAAQQAADAARRETEERLLAEAAREAQEAARAAEVSARQAAQEAAEAARREAEERLLAEAEILAFEAADAARRETETRLRDEAARREAELEERLQLAETAAREAETAAREAEERVVRVVEEERALREQTEHMLHLREEELNRHRRRWGFRPGAALGGEVDPEAAAASVHDGGTGASALGVGRISWWGADASGVPLGAVTFAPGGELSVEPPPPPESWVALDPPEGRFGDGELPTFLWSAHVLEVTGSVVLEDERGLTRTLYLERGEPVGFASDLSRDRPEEALLRAGLITAAKHTELRAGPLRSARRACAHLVDEGSLKPQELFTAIRGVLIEQVLSLLEMPGGTFRYEREAAHASDRVRLQHGFDALLTEGVRRKYDLPRLWRVLGGAQTLVGKDDRAVRLPPLTQEERAALALLDGQRSLEDAVLDGGLPAEDVLRAALVGISCGAARVLARGVPGAPVEERLDHERALAIDKARIEDRLHAARHGDYFVFLGIAPESTSFEVRRAADHVRRQFDPRRYSDPAFRELKDALEEIRQVADEAEAVLSDDALRAGYLRGLVSRRVALH